MLTVLPGSYMAELALFVDDTDDARRWAHRGLRINPQSAPLALVLARTGDDPAFELRAVDVLNGAVAAHPTYPDLRAAMIRAGKVRRRPRRCVARPASSEGLARQTQPGSHPIARRVEQEIAALTIIKSQQASEQLDLARAAFDAQMFGVAATHVKRLLEIDPSMTAARILEARLKLQQNQPRQALAALDADGLYNPDDRNRPEVAMLRVQGLIAAKGTNELLPCSELDAKLTEAFPDDVRFHRMIAALAMKAGTTDRAVAALTEVVRLEPADRPARMNLARLLADAKPEAAIALLERKEYKNDLGVRLQLARLYHAAGRDREAEETYASHCSTRPPMKKRSAARPASWPIRSAATGWRLRRLRRAVEPSGRKEGVESWITAAGGDAAARGAGRAGRPLLVANYAARPGQRPGLGGAFGLCLGSAAARVGSHRAKSIDRSNEQTRTAAAARRALAAHGRRHGRATHDLRHRRPVAGGIPPPPPADPGRGHARAARPEKPDPRRRPPPPGRLPRGNERSPWRVRRRERCAEDQPRLRRGGPPAGTVAAGGVATDLLLPFPSHIRVAAEHLRRLVNAILTRDRARTHLTSIGREGQIGLEAERAGVRGLERASLPQGCLHTFQAEHRAVMALAHRGQAGLRVPIGSAEVAEDDDAAVFGSLHG